MFFFNFSFRIIKKPQHWQHWPPVAWPSYWTNTFIHKNRKTYMPFKRNKDMLASYWCFVLKKKSAPHVLWISYAKGTPMIYLSPELYSHHEKIYFLMCLHWQLLCSFTKMIILTVQEKIINLRYYNILTYMNSKSCLTCLIRTCQVLVDIPPACTVLSFWISIWSDPCFRNVFT